MYVVIGSALIGSDAWQFASRSVVTGENNYKTAAIE
jgi:hypothetical protein